MNANELADKLEEMGLHGAAAMLRQQQAEVEELKKEAALQRLSDFTQEAEKTLTDEEIENIYWSLDSTGYDGCFSFIEFARAILRKASET